MTEYIESIAFQVLGDAAAANEMILKSLAGWERINHRGGMQACLVRLAGIMCTTGNWTEARNYVSRTSEIGVHRIAARSLFIEAMTDGDPERIGEHASTMVTEPGKLAMELREIAMLALIGRMTDRPEFVDRAVDYAAEALKVEPPHTPFRRQMCDATMAIAAISNQDAIQADHSYDALKITAGQMIGGDIVSGDHLLALLAESADKLELAEEHFDAAVEFCVSAGYRPELAWTRADYAEMLLARNATGDKEKAVELQDKAIAIATELGMQPLLERVLAQREILKA